jgi:ectoine hydroxylase-related dioxygenase (phytanoyl-CoA dioxygenase family)
LRDGSATCSTTIVYLHQSRLNYKPGFTGKEFYWHSDFETWHAEDGMPRMRAISASILLTDNDALNGPLMLMPGSHRTFVACAGETPDDNHKIVAQEAGVGVPSHDSADPDGPNRFGIDYAAGKAGTVVLFDCNTLHGSNGNITPFPRSNAFFVYNAWSNKVGAVRRQVAPPGLPVVARSGRRRSRSSPARSTSNVAKSRPRRRLYQKTIAAARAWRARNTGDHMTIDRLIASRRSAAPRCRAAELLDTVLIGDRKGEASTTASSSCRPMAA